MHTQRTLRPFCTPATFRFSRILTALTVLLLASGVLSAQEESPLLHTAKKHVLEGECEQAVLLFGEHLRQHGFDKEAYYWRAHCLIQLDLIDEAITDLKYILQFHKEDVRAMDALGYAYNQSGQYLEAINWFNKAVVYDSENPVIYNNRGMSYYYLGKYPTAFYDFNKAVRLDSTFAEAYGNRGSTRYNNQNIAAATKIDLTKAEADFSKAIELDPTLVSAYRNRGIIRSYLGDREGAYLDFKKALHLYPSDANVFMHLGRLMSDQKEYIESIRYMEEALRLKPNLIEAHFGRAESLEALGQTEKARFDYEAVLEKDPSLRGQCFYLMARNYAIEGNGDEVLHMLKQARKYEFFKEEGALQKATSDPLLAPYWEREEFAKLRDRIQ